MPLSITSDGGYVPLFTQRCHLCKECLSTISPGHLCWIDFEPTLDGMSTFAIFQDGIQYSIRSRAHHVAFLRLKRLIHWDFCRVISLLGVWVCCIIAIVFCSLGDSGVYLAWASIRVLSEVGVGSNHHVEGLATTFSLWGREVSHGSVFLVSNDLSCRSTTQYSVM